MIWLLLGIKITFFFHQSPSYHAPSLPVTNSWLQISNEPCRYPWNIFLTHFFLFLKCKQFLVFRLAPRLPWQRRCQFGISLVYFCIVIVLEEWKAEVCVCVIDFRHMCASCLLYPSCQAQVQNSPIFCMDFFVWILCAGKHYYLYPELLLVICIT